MADSWLWPVLLGVLGAIAGSFIATLAIRWPQGRTVGKGRSACDHCGIRLAARDLVPIASALALRGRCRGCGGAIDPLHWQVELAAAVMGVATAFVVPGPLAMAGAGFGWLLLALAVIDLRAFWLPDALTLALAVLGIASGLLGIAPTLADRVIGGAAAFASLWLIARGYRLLRGREGMGGGDPKLFGAIGLWLGWAMLPAVLLLAALTGLAVVALRAVRGKPVRMDDRVPFGALLAVAAYPAWLFLIGSQP